MITWRYDIWAIAADESVISGTATTAITGKNKAMEAAIKLFKTVSPAPWRVIVQPYVYKVNGRLSPHCLPWREKLDE